MIRYSMVCAREHGFDGWFRGSDDFDAQAERGLLSCPVCGSSQVRKALMAPAVTGTDRAEAVPPSGEVALIGERERALREMVRRVRSEVMANARDVGGDFARVARQMHEGEIDHASIYGRASSEEARSLAEDGIEVYPLPIAPEDGN